MRRTFMTSVAALVAVLVLAGCAGDHRNYREGSGVVEGTTRAIDGITK